MSASVAGARSHPDDLRRASRTKVLRTLHLRGAATRADLGVALGLNRSTIKAVVDTLAADGYVTQSVPRSVGARPTGAGRPSTVVEVRPESAWAMAAEVAVGRLTVAAVGLGGGVLGRPCTRRLPADADPVVVVGLLRDVASSMIAEFGAEPLGIGVSVPGLVRARDGAVRRAPNLGWSEVALGAMMTAATGLAVHVCNDSDLGALSEHLRGCARDVEHLVYLEVDVGVGGGVIDGGDGVGGSGGYAGEIGHMVLRRPGRPCRCGSHGCWETEIGESALVRAVGLAEGAGRAELLRRLRVLSTGAESGLADDHLTDELREYGERLADGVGNLVNLFDPQTVVFGGVLADALPLVVDAVADHLRQFCLVDRHVSLRASTLGASGPLLGAAETVFALFLERC